MRRSEVGGEEKQRVENPKSNTLLFKSFTSWNCAKHLDAGT